MSSVLRGLSLKGWLIFFVVFSISAFITTFLEPLVNTGNSGLDGILLMILPSTVLYIVLRKFMKGDVE